MRIGELAERTGVSTRSLRYYEQQGLITARRTANGYREYDESDVRLVAEIRALLAAGFALEDARPFVNCLRAGHPAGDSCPESVAVYRRKLAEIDAEIHDLIRRRADVADQLARACPGCALTREQINDHVDHGELRRAGARRGQAGPRRVLG
ncbi:MerR family transcriptional regulator [Spongiactinospora rosea]|uniref:MerR family transcriptional regulator n=1 Tax=Spongiactinospora rosea TaxID=2248750 RepID=A0A366M6J2_9ACTN|nr:MerR family transcriptional regulator [Spongiactinospora rosea]RBQ21861.1 MerR family transcriptional regulator [Spongiactinospora rosea]